MTINIKTPITKKPNLYSDFHKDLRISPISKDIALLKDEDAVKQSIKNLILTDPGERLMQPYVGGGIKGLLFENITPGVLKVIETRCRDTINTFESRAELINVTASSSYDDNTVNVFIQFYIRNVDKPITLDLILERIR
jgi:phage baseplate assembly protein W|tara:strand:- start:2283 stop:2699 length:417 start_codon:yes stop_codon:yes gene_type:complete